MANTSEAFVLDMLERAGKTFLQAALGAAAPVITVVDGRHIVNGTWWQQLGVIALTAGIASFGSFITSVLSGLKTNTASASTTVAQTAVVKDSADPAAEAPAAADDLPAPVLAPDATPGDAAEAAAPVTSAEPTPGEFTSEGATA